MRGRPRGRLFTPRRVETVELLSESGMLPAIYFIFSRAGCDEAVAQCVREGRRLTTPEERRTIRAVADAHLEALSDEDLQILDYNGWISGLEAGFASHHAGLVPPFKEAVEELFAAGLVRAVFATETLSLGINMPARSVAIEKLTKFTGERHEFLTPGEYTQLTGRAGRRGIDEVGYAVVLWSPFVPFDQVAGLAGSRSYTLTSSFRPTYNMAANLVRRYPPDLAHHLLNLSFAQYRADSDVVRLEAQLERSQAALVEARAAARCDRGDVAEYRELLRADETGGHRRASSAAAVGAALGRVRPGDVVLVGANGRRPRPAAVLSTTRRRGGEIRLRAVTADRRVLALGSQDFGAPPPVVGRVALPTPFAPKDPGFQRRVAASLRKADLGRPVTPGPAGPARRASAWSMEASPAASHPVASCPDVRAHLRAFERADRLARDAERLEERVRRRTESLARQFDRVLRVLEAWGYVDGWALTESGERLAGLYHESDLLIAESVGEGLLDGLSPADLAGLVSVFTYEARSPAEPLARWPSAGLRQRGTRVEQVAAKLNQAEEDAGLPLTRLPDAGFVALAHDWAGGDDLASVLDADEISGGDFVRNVKQLIDLLRQLADLVPNPATAAAARRAVDGLFRGVVAASSALPAVSGTA
jgi:ATP-dependent RNA helicase HelY